MGSSKPLGLGISRAKFRSLFKELGLLVKGKEINEQENWVSQDKARGAWLQVVGPYENVTSVSLCITVPSNSKNDAANEQLVNKFGDLFFAPQDNPYAWWVGNLQTALATGTVSREYHGYYLFTLLGKAFPDGAVFIWTVNNAGHTDIYPGNRKGLAAKDVSDDNTPVLVSG